MRGFALVSHDYMKLSVIVPVYNEKRTISVILEKVREVPVNKEIIVVDGNSIDGTRDLLKEEENKPDTRIIYMPHRCGRGLALKIGIENAKGDVIIFQDADLELDPADYPALLKPIEEGKADVVFGSRFLGQSDEYMSFLQKLGNKGLTGLVNLMYGSKLTDVETCYQVFKKEALKGIRIKGDEFNFTIELSVKLLKKKYPVMEIPITYIPRGREEGKKIRWRDGFESLYALVKYKFVD